ncbi:1500_t:CDS:2 [Funneliformis mosseae]|uniref:1500_t:CDS:1 n=1 Tax=Funneliformis mosseae TaxID=27381 RepID=A0A9N9N9G8_FUNMO|nr:1500_t:CDS:2 [Funneliformis mosseae]
MKATSQIELEQIFLDIETSGENGIEASFNSLISLMDPEIWNRCENNTNAAEAAHALAIRTSKQLKLLTEILLNSSSFSSSLYEARQKSNKKTSTAINRKEKRNQKSNENSEKALGKRKYLRSTTKKMQPVIISENDSEEVRRIYLELEIEERKMSLKERDIALKKAAAEAVAIELANEKLKLSLKR